MPEVILSDYFYGVESEEFIYFKIPRLLITDQKFKHVSTDAKLLYGMLLDRMGLSAKNNWYDDYGRVYIYYTVDEICEDMCCGRDKAMKLLLHPAYLEKSDYNTVSVDTKSEDYAELKKSIELNGVKDPVLARIGEKGTLEIISGQRRHMIATELNYPVPTIIQKISDADAKILVADGNLHRPKISTYDLSRTLRMKMEGMKQKAGRRKKGSFKAEELYSDARQSKNQRVKR